MSALGRVLAGVLMVSVMAPSALAQSGSPPPIIFQPEPDSPIGVRNPNAPAQSQQLEFLIGDWDVALTLYQPDREAVSFRARWHNHWIVDGHVVMQEWRGPYATGTELRSFNPETGQWDGRNYYTFRKTWTESTGEYVDGEFIIETRGVGPDGPFINRERYYDIQPDTFRMNAMRSQDGGATWSSITYEMLCTRIE